MPTKDFMEATMRNVTFKAIGNAVLFTAGLILTGALLVPSSAAQYARQTQPPAPRPAPVPQRQPAPAPRQAPAPAPQSAPAPAAPRQPNPTPQQHSSQPAPQKPTVAPPPAQRSQQPQQPTQQQKQAQQNQARQQKEQQKLQENQKKDQARAQKDAQKEEQKQQQQKARDARQQQRLQAEQQKAQIKQQKQVEKLKTKQDKPSVGAPVSKVSESNTVRASSTPASPSKPSVTPENHSAAYAISGKDAITSKTSAGDSILSSRGSRDVVQQLNANRSSRTGINRSALPAGDVTVHANGNVVLRTPSGSQYGIRSNGTIASFSANGKSASFDGNGRVSSIHTTTMDIQRSANGQRTIVSHRPDNITVVSTGHHAGYIESTVSHNNATYIQRTVVTNNRIVTNSYVAYGLRGTALNHFVSPVFYSPAFYGWAFYPWISPVAYSWGWGAAPWYGGSNPYFAAYPTYLSASSWLTDYFLGETIAATNAESQDAMTDAADDLVNVDSSENASGSNETDDIDTIHASISTPITPEIKKAIEEEVKVQIEAENTAAAHPDNATSYGELPSALGNVNYVFVVAKSLDVTTADQQTCGLRPGDVLRLAAPPADGLPLAQLLVASSKVTDCPAGVRVSVSLQDLQEMQSNFREQVIQGLGTLYANQGKDGLPAAPPEALSAPPRPATTIQPAMSSTEAISLLDTQSQQADAIETDMTQSALSGHGRGIN